MPADVAMTSAELCAGGGAALGLERAGFSHVLLAEIDPDACATLQTSCPGWKVDQGDIRQLDGRQLAGVDLLSGGCLASHSQSVAVNSARLTLATCSPRRCG